MPEAVPVPPPVRHLAQRLLAGEDPVAVLAAWCTRHGIGHGPVRAFPRLDLPRPLSPPRPLLEHLAPAPEEPVRHRRVTLTRGPAALADGDLWWLPARLPPGIAEALDRGEGAFGDLVAPLIPARRTVFAGVFPPGCDRLLEHGAVVEAALRGGRRALAAERMLYRGALLAA